MKVSELEGPLLDYWVARAIGVPAENTSPCLVDFGGWLEPFCPSSNWRQGGRLLHDYRIEIHSLNTTARTLANAPLRR